ncbi:MAG: energy-coupling factor transporter ATPase [Oscillospiraceae bacterium]|nr:energy-coupling factor transporter ATPase [Oscillospiraceae bacterium]MBR4691578.1 energy-coupling factor transporter ATPase [Oscillospiraceae bacterium]
MSPLIETKKLTHIYSEGTPFEHVAVRDVDFSAARGEFIGIIGHTGSGKSTFVQHLNGILKPTSGSVLLEGEDVNGSAAVTRRVRGRVGLVFQYPEYQLFEETVRADIAYGPKNMKLGKEEIEQRVLEAADFVGLEASLLDHSPFDLSGGQKRRAAIAGVIAMRPDVLVLDEPTAGLDPRGREEIIRNICRYHDAVGGTVLYITHSMEDIARFATRLVVFNRGQIALDGAPEEVFRHVEELERIGLTVPSVTKVFSILRSRGLEVAEGIYTVDAAVEALLRLKGGGGNA